MRLSVSKNSEVPLKEQLVTQIVLAIACHEIKPLEKLPSTRELARRLDIHSNTISAAYRDLCRRGWLLFRSGSGIYVRDPKGNPPLDGCLELDQMISAFIRLARERGFSLEQIRSRAKLWLELQSPDHFPLIDPDPELRRILCQEISEATRFPVREATLNDLAQKEILVGAAPVELFGLAEEARAALPLDTSLFLLHTRSTQALLEKLQSLPQHALISVASRWPGFLRWAHPMLAASKIDPNLLSLRDARHKRWEAGLGAHSFVITDVITATHIPAKCHIFIFRIISDSSLQDLRACARDYQSGSGRLHKSAF